MPLVPELDVTDRTCDVGGITIHYVEAGQGPLIVLLHGFPEFWYSWRHQIPALAAAPGPIRASTIVMTPGTARTIKLLVVDDVPSVRRGLRMRLSLECDLQVVGEAASGEEALAVVRALQPDVILMDIEMPGIDGLVATSAMRSVAPQSAVVTLSLHDDAASREKALAAGATAFVGKHEASEALLLAIRDAAKPAA